MRGLSSDLEGIVRDLGLYEEFSLEIIRREIDTLLPPPLGEHLYPWSLRSGQLVILVDSQEWLNELRMQRGEVERRLSALGVRSVRFKLGRPPIRRRRSTRVVKDPSVEAPPELVELVEGNIKDPDLRETVLDAIRSSLRRRKT